MWRFLMLFVLLTRQKDPNFIAMSGIGDSKAAFEFVYKLIRAYEGGEVNHPFDRGGHTYAGISRRAWSNWAGWEYVDRGLVVPERLVYDFYYELYVQNNMHEIHHPKAAYAFDYIVGTGVYAIKDIQAVVGVFQDGVLGPVTRDAINKMDAESFLYKLAFMRLKRYLRISLADASQRVFLLGWMRRALEMLDLCLYEARRGAAKGGG